MKTGDRVVVYWIDEETENTFRVVRVVTESEVVLRMIPGPRDDVPDGDSTFVRRGEYWHEFDSDIARAKITVHTSARPRYVVRPTDDRDCDEPRQNWDVCDRNHLDDQGQPIAIETHRTRSLARDAARAMNADVMPVNSCRICGDRACDGTKHERAADRPAEDARGGAHRP